jgi:hypothetical protein
MKTGLALCVVSFACLWLGGPGGPCPGGLFLIGLPLAVLGWLVCFAALGVAASESVKQMIVPGATAALATSGIISLGSGRWWNVAEPESWIAVALFFLVSLTSAGVFVRRRIQAQ